MMSEFLYYGKGLLLKYSKTPALRPARTVIIFVSQFGEYICEVHESFLVLLHRHEKNATRSLKKHKTGQ